MKPKFLLALMFACFSVSTVTADPPKGFEEFRKGLLSDFNSFRNRILDHYADFLAGEWHEYEALEGVEKYSSPKPSVIPVVEIDSVAEGDEQKKDLMATFGFINNEYTFKPTLQDKTDILQNDFLNWLKNTSDLYNSAVFDLKKQDKVTLPEKQESFLEEINSDKLPEKFEGGSSDKYKGNIMTEYGLVSNFIGDIFTFYGMNFALPNIDIEVVPHINEMDDFPLQWSLLADQSAADKLLPHIKKLQEASGLSDYLMFELIMSYADYKFPHANDASKMAFAHYVLANMGFGVRLALDNNAQPFMLIPFEEEIFGCTNLTLDKKYYLFSTPGRENVKRMGLRTPSLPANTDLGKSLSLRMEGLTLPYTPAPYSFEYNGLKLEGELNRNIIPLLYKYPKMDTGGFAASVISKDVRNDVVKQLKNQLASDDPIKAADKLLAMIQYAFPYATDDEFHGFEKPYFFEETLFYPKSDCEDRAVFYSYLLWNALGLENDLIAYPNHEATAIKAEKVWGGDMHYMRQGSKFFISDPTFQGAPTGNGMRQFSTFDPKIDLSYSKEE